MNPINFSCTKGSSHLAAGTVLYAGDASEVTVGLVLVVSFYSLELKGVS